ncbi:nitrogen regulation protein NR(II) [Chitinimonas sp.]|uniref:two-component system sensor histidine kinase NtrB n=1 Tax=Chitinimonas sp. TaxID=1934313 RepID=UPI0035B3A093
MSSDPKHLVSDAYWRSAKVFNLFRAVLALGLASANLLLHRQMFGELENRTALDVLFIGYLLLVAANGICLRLRWPRFRLLLTAQVAGDILFIVGIMHLAGGLKTGVGLLLLPNLAAAGLISRGRTTLFHAALASIAVLLQQLVQAMGGGGADFFQAAMLSIACFTSAWLAYRLAGYASESEQLAARRGADLANMAQINRLVMQDVSDGVMVLDEFDVVRQFNHRVEQTLGSGLIAGKTRLADYSPPLAHALAHWREGGTPTMTEFDALRLRVRPRFMPVKVGVSSSGTVIFLEDTARLRREAQQVKLAALGRLTANIAHEIRNPLSAISHAAQLLAEDKSDPATARLTRIITDNTHRLERMVREVLDLNRRDRAEPVDIRLYDWLSRFASEFAEVEHLPAALLLDCPQGAVARFDEGQLHQVLWNLCRNGWRYGKKQHDSLRLRVARLDDSWVLEVQDDGAGVAADDIGKLFEPFFTTDAKGTGLGLYIAREICAGNDSVLEYVPPAGPLSPAGACFRIVFPAKPT